MSARPDDRVRERRRTPVDSVTVLLLTRNASARGDGDPAGDPAGDRDDVHDALAAQTHRPDEIVVVDLASSPRPKREASGSVADQGDPVSPIAALRRATADLPAEPGQWWWLLHEDSVPAPDALAELVAAARRTRDAAVVGPKLVALDDPRRLLSVGIRLTRAGRPAEPALAGQLDQGQHDERSDVLGVPLAGMLVRAEVFTELGGLDRAFDHGTEGLDLSWRAHLAGHRVVLAPDAVVRQGPQGAPVTGLTARRRTRQLALARGAFLPSLVRGLGVVLTSALAALGLLLVKRPGPAAQELTDVSGALAFGRGLGARWRFRGHRELRDRDVAGLFAPPRAAWRAAREAGRGQPALRSGRGGTGLTAEQGGAVETGPMADEAVSLERAPAHRPGWAWPLGLLLVAASVAAVARWWDLRSALAGGGWGARGGELWPVSAGSGAVWDAWWQGWSGAGMGQAGSGPPWLVPMAGLTWLVEHLPGVDPSASPAGVAVTWLLLTAVPLSALSGFVAAGLGTRSGWVRAAAGLVWAGAAPLSVAVTQGRVGPVVCHVLMPLAVAGAAVAGSRREGSRRTTVAFATVLAFTVAAWFVPLVLVVSALAGLLMLVLGRGWGRLRGLAVALLPALLQGPWLGRLADEPRLLLSGAGATTTDAAVPPWQLLLQHPGGPLSPMLWWSLPVLILAVVAALLPGRRGRRAGALLLGALLALAGAVALGQVVIGWMPQGYVDEGSPVTAWPGTVLSVVGAALLLGATVAVGALVDRSPEAVEQRTGGAATWRASGTTVAAGVAVVAGVAMLAGTALAGTGSLLGVATRPLPAVVTEQAAGPEGMRALELIPAGSAVGYRLSGVEPGTWLRDRAGEIVTASTAPADGAGAAALADTAGLLAGQHSALVPSQATDELHDLAVGYVVLRAGPDHPLVARLDATAGLTRLSASPDRVLWRVASQGSADHLVSVSRLVVTDAEGLPIGGVTTAGSHGATDAVLASPAPAGSALRVSEPAGWASAAVVSADGRPLSATPDAWPVQYPLPEGTRQIEVSVPSPDRWWQLGTGALLVVVGFLALPFGTRARRPVERRR